MSAVVRISATGAGANYYPEFVARYLGFFAQEGLSIEVEVLGNGPGVPHAVGSGQADLGLGGIWLPMLYRGRLDTFVPFAQLCNRLAAVLLARQPIPNFTWSDVRDRIMLAPGGAPNFWMIVAALLDDAGVSPSSLRYIPDFVGNEVVNLFRGGFADFFIAMPPLAEQLVDEGVGVVVYDFADFGDIPWSIFYALPAFFTRSDDPAPRFARAIQRGLAWALDHDPLEAPHILEACFPKLHPDLAARAIRNCRERAVWSRRVGIPEASLLRWQSIIQRHGRLIDRPMAYDDIVNPHPAADVDAALAA